MVSVQMRLLDIDVPEDSADRFCGSGGPYRQSVTMTQNLGRRKLLFLQLILELVKVLFNPPVMFVGRDLSRCENHVVLTVCALPEYMFLTSITSPKAALLYSSNALA